MQALNREDLTGFYRNDYLCRRKPARYYVFIDDRTLTRE
jgi:hypothetical protein